MGVFGGRGLGEDVLIDDRFLSVEEDHTYSVSILRGVLH